MADIFISYTSSDSDWAKWIAKELKALGHSPHVHEWEIKAGENIYAWMEKRHDEADHVLCVLSDDYLDRVKAPYSAVERDAALWQAAAKRPGFVLFVAVKPCRLPTLADHYRRCELFGISDDVAHTSFREFMAKRGDASPIAFPGEAFAVSNIPIRVPTHFLGRDDSLAAIAAALARYEGRVAITALHGLRGVGKTTLAAAYAERHRGDYRATWWIRAQTESTMRADLVGLGVRLNWVAADEKEEPALAAVMERLRHEGESCLLIYDNAIDAEALRPYLPRGGAARVLVTSNARTWRGVAEPVEIRLWPAAIGADYLVARTGREQERVAALALSEALGGLPLAHEQVAAYCERLDMPFADYHQRFEAAPAKFLDDTRHAPAEYNDGLTVAKTFALAIEKAAKLHPAAEPLIMHAALLAPEPIPLFLFSEGREKLGEPLASALAGDGLIEAVAALRAFALVDREMIPDERDPAITTDCIRLHRLVRQVVARGGGGAHEQARCALVIAMATVYPDEVNNDPKVWPRTRRLDGIALALVGGNCELSKCAEEALAVLLNKLGRYRHWPLGDLAAARPLFERSLAIREKVLGPEHPDTATSLTVLGNLLQDQGEPAGARPLYERALAIYERVLGSEHPLTATCINNLAHLLNAQGDVAGARALYERALDIREGLFGLEHPDTAWSLTNLGSLLFSQKDLAAAGPLLRRGLAIYEKVDPEGLDTAWSLTHNASLLHAEGDLAGAISLWERVVRINEEVFGREHPDVANSLVRLGLMLQENGDPVSAKSCHARALAIYEKMLGPEHLATVASVNNLAYAMQAQGDFLGAQPLYGRAISVGDKALGAGHPLPNRSRRHLAGLLLSMGEPSEALALGKTALAAHDKVLGPAHPWTKDSAGVTADALDALGRSEEAKALRAKYGIEASSAEKK